MKRAFRKADFYYSIIKVPLLTIAVTDLPYFLTVRYFIVDF